MRYELFDMETNNSYGIFDTYEDAYTEKINVNHRIHMVCGGDFFVKLDIRENENTTNDAE